MRVNRRLFRLKTYIFLDFHLIDTRSERKFNEVSVVGNTLRYALICLSEPELQRERGGEMLRPEKFSIYMYIYPVPKYSAKYITTRSALDIS